MASQRQAQAQAQVAGDDEDMGVAVKETDDQETKVDDARLLSDRVRETDSLLSRFTFFFFASSALNSFRFVLWFLFISAFC